MPVNGIAAPLQPSPNALNGGAGATAGATATSNFIVGQPGSPAGNYYIYIYENKHTFFINI